MDTIDLIKLYKIDVNYCAARNKKFHWQAITDSLVKSTFNPSLHYRVSEFADNLDSAVAKVVITILAAKAAEMEVADV